MDRGLSLAAAAVFVLPVLALAPRLRQPPIWLAALWGAAAAALFSAVVFGPGQRLQASRGARLGVGLSGAASGTLYAILVRRHRA